MHLYVTFGFKVLSVLKEKILTWRNLKLVASEHGLFSPSKQFIHKSILPQIPQSCFLQKKLWKGVFKACKFTTNLKLFKACNITTNKCRKSIFPVFLQHLLVVKTLLQCKILQWFRNVVNTNICYICCNIFRELDLAIFWKWALQPDVGQVASFPWSWCCGRGLRSFSSQ